MSTGVIVAIVAVVIVVAIIAAVMMQRGDGGPGLKRRFGPEYERTLARHDGDTRATRRELTERVKRYGDIERRELPAEARDRYTAQWNAVQAQFVDDPKAAIASADELIARLSAERGFPAVDSPEHVDALSVHHPHHVHGYREVHAVTTGEGRQGTEDLRKALVAARGMFDDVLNGSGSDRRDDDGVAAEETEPEAATDESKPVRNKRLAALTGRGRTETEQ